MQRTSSAGEGVRRVFKTERGARSLRVGLMGLAMVLLGKKTVRRRKENTARKDCIFVGLMDSVVVLREFWET